LPQKKILCALILIKIEVGYILGDFLTNSSGQPGWRLQMHNTKMAAYAPQRTNVRSLRQQNQKMMD
jgi:hypothetical protein